MRSKCLLAIFLILITQKGYTGQPLPETIFVCKDENGRIGTWVKDFEQKSAPGWCEGPSMQRDSYYIEKSQMEYQEKVKNTAKFLDDVEGLRRK